MKRLLAVVVVAVGVIFARTASCGDTVARTPGDLVVGVLCKSTNDECEVFAALSAVKGLSVRRVTAKDVEKGVLRAIDAFVLPEGAKEPEVAVSGIAEFAAHGGFVVRNGGSAVVDELLRIRSAPPPVPQPWPEKAADAMKVVVFRGRGVGDDLVARRLDVCPEFDLKFANGADIAAGALDGADLVVHPGGSGEGQFFELGTNGVAAEREFLRRGGMYHGTCAGAFLVLQPTRRKRNQLVPFKPDDPGEYRGGATVRIDFTEEGQAALGVGRERMVWYHGGPAMIPGASVAEADIKVLARYGGAAVDAEKPKLIATMAGKAAMLGGTFGKGRLFICGPHPEQSDATAGMFYSGLEWLTGRKLSPQPRWHLRGAPNVFVRNGRRTVENARLAQAIWRDVSLNFVDTPGECDVAVVTEPVAATFKILAGYHGPMVLMATLPDAKSEVKKHRLEGAVRVKTADEALRKMREILSAARR
ncbi:MAG: hypothetical protein IJQ65_08400 [Kiritimatiellae bacterium]|nr:hypothetical protein [Kiritimatiellia bacterium]